MSESSRIVLLVEDNPDDVFLTMRAFKKNNITNEIVVASDGVEALELLLPEDGREPLRPVIVLLDINMPRMGGLEVLQRLQADPRTKTLPVIMLTTSTEKRDVADSYTFGANSYVPKPVTADEFLAASMALGAYWLDFNLQPRPGTPTKRA